MHSLYDNHPDLPQGMAISLAVSAHGIAEQRFPAVYRRVGNEIRLLSDDGSYVAHLLDELGFAPPGTSTWHDDIDTLDKPPRPLDSGSALLEPVTESEFHAAERLLTHLARLVETENLSTLQEERILAMAELIRETRLEVVPGSTPRWRLVRTIRAAAICVARLSQGCACTCRPRAGSRRNGLD